MPENDDRSVKLAQLLGHVPEYMAVVPNQWGSNSQAPTPDQPEKALNDLFAVRRCYEDWTSSAQSAWRWLQGGPLDWDARRAIARAESGPVANLREKFEARLKEWCGVYGLLGLLHSRTAKGPDRDYFIRDFGPNRPPPPEEEAFWLNYMEPVDNMMVAAYRLYVTARALAMGGKDTYLKLAAEYLNQTAQGPRLIASVARGHIQTELVYDCLLDCVAGALLRSKELGFYFKVCAAADCRMPVFLARRSDAKWCPDGGCRGRVWARQNA